MKNKEDQTALIILTAMINASETKMKALWNMGYNMHKDANAEEVYMKSLIAQRNFIREEGSETFLKAEHQTRP